MIFYRIARARFDTPATAFSGEAASKINHRWNYAASDIRAVYCSDSLALACLECLVHIRPLPRTLPQSLYYRIEIPDSLLQLPSLEELPAGWDSELAGSASRDYGMAFLRTKERAGLVIPTVIQPLGQNLLLNPLHPAFTLKWIQGPFPYRYDGRLE